jgi:phosphatidylserine/phosphatidylglycerophosphate/cardiolipin synthase-like enzyme
MKFILSAILLSVLIMFSCTPIYEDSMKVYFSPNGGAEEAIVQALKSAKFEVLVQAYSLTSEPIIDALIDVENRGIDVGIILDRRAESEYKVIWPRLKKDSIYVRIDTQYGLAHNKIMVIDSNLVITGSYNYSKGAEIKNRENLLVIQNHLLAMEYLNHWYMRDSVSRNPRRKRK